MTELRDTLAAQPVTASETVFEGAVWDVRRETFDFAGQTLTREVIGHPGAVAVLALDDADQVTVIRQYRHPVGAWAWELPAGLLDVTDEPPLAAAARELGEEVDLTATTWHVLVDIWPTPGGSSEAVRVYLARGLGEVPAEQRHVREGEEADMAVSRVDLDELHEAVLAGHLHNPTLVVGVLTAHALRARGWAGLQAGDAPWPEHPRFRSSEAGA